MYTIYKITNILNNKVYIGQTMQFIEKRITYHFSYLKRNQHSNQYLQKSYNKYGKDSFIWEVLEKEITSSEDAMIREQFYIDKEKSLLEEFGFNLKNAGSKGKQLDSTKKKISDTLNKNGKKNKKILQYEIKTGKIITEWDSSIKCEKSTGIRAANIIQHMNGNPSYNHVAGYGFIRYEEYLEKGITAKPEFVSREIKLKSIKSICIYTGEIKKFKSISEAVFLYKPKKYENIHRVLRGDRNSWNGYKFEYI
jgi:group I intron endonuclease